MTNVDNTDILCNLCGESTCINVDRESLKLKSEDSHGLIKAKVRCGYNSFYLSDLTEYQFSLCEKCLRDLFIKFKIKPDIIDIDGAITWEEDFFLYEETLWRADGLDYKAYCNGYCNAVKDCPNKAIYSIILSDEFTENCCCEEHKSKWEFTLNAKIVDFISKEVSTFL